MLHLKHNSDLRRALLRMSGHDDFDVGSALVPLNCNFPMDDCAVLGCQPLVQPSINFPRNIDLGLRPVTTQPATTSFIVPKVKHVPDGRIPDRSLQFAKTF